MKRILSIDFDYFLDTSVEVRNQLFPNGLDEKNFKDLIRDWEYSYLKYPNIEGIQVSEKAYLNVCEYLIKSKCPVVTSDSHKFIYNLFNKGEDYLVDNIDFHHDFYIGKNPNFVDCSNWLRILMEENPNNKVRWFRREDSETYSIIGEFPYESFTKLNLMDFYDLIFLCFSPEWTPPHLRGFYNLMIKCAMYKEVKHNGH